jgi:hypothetical protein
MHIFKENNLLKPENWKLWISLSLIFKGTFFLFLINRGEFNSVEGFWGAIGGDTDSYLLPLENLIKNGKYEPGYRLPGYGLFYLPLFLMFEKSIALNILILMQFFASSLSVYFLALIARKCFLTDKIFYIAFFIFAISTYSNMYDHMPISESFTTAFLIFSIFFFIKWFDSDNNFYLILSGIFFTQIIFLRPVFLPVLGLFCLVIARKGNFKVSYLKPVLFFLMPFFIVDGAWILRNYNLYNRIAPLTISLVESEIEAQANDAEFNHKTPLITISIVDSTLENSINWAVAKFIQSWGGNYLWWDPVAEIRFFNFKETLHEGHNPLVDKDIAIPSYIYTSQFNKDSLLNLRDKIITIQSDTSLSSSEIDLNTSYVKAKFENYTLSIKKEKPFLYYFGSKFMLLKKFLIHSGTYNFFTKSTEKLNTVEYSVKVLYSLFYIFVLISAFFSFILLLRDSVLFKPISIITGIPAYIIFVHPFVLRFCEARYLVPVWPLLIICSSYFILWMFEKVKTKQISFLSHPR